MTLDEINDQIKIDTDGEHDLNSGISDEGKTELLETGSLTIYVGEKKIVVALTFTEEK